LSFGAPTKSGTYVIQVYATATGGSGIIRSSILSWTVTVAAAPKATSAYVHLVAGARAANPGVGQADSVTSGSKVVSTTEIGRIGVSLLSAAGASVTESYTATITGAGILGVATGAPLGRSLTVKNSDQVNIFSDGSAGPGTITISSAAGVILATKTVSFYGDAAAIVLTVNSTVAVGPNTAPITAVVYDANGYLVPSVRLYATSSDLTVVSNSYTQSASTTSVAKGDASIALTGVKLGTAKITVGLATSATDVTTTGYAVKSDAATVTVAGGTTELADVLVTTDKTSYTPGANAYVYVNPVDKDGKTLAPGSYTVFASGGIAGSQSFETLTGIISSTSITTASKATSSSDLTVANPLGDIAGQKLYKIKLPTIEGDFVLSWTTAAASTFPGNIANGAQARSTTLSIANPGTALAVDAANEATDAANAATDAALAAADAADAATAAAEDASVAVDTLSKKVTTALGNLKKQITALTALVNKLLKR
jgi:hypothetical protein